MVAYDDTNEQNNNTHLYIEQVYNTNYVYFEWSSLDIWANISCWTFEE